MPYLYLDIFSSHFPLNTPPFCPDFLQLLYGIIIFYIHIYYNSSANSLIVDPMFFYIRGLFKPCSDLWPGKIHLHAWRSATLISFEVVSLRLNTILPAVRPLLETFLECYLVNGVQLGRRVPSNVASWLKSSPFQLRFQVVEQPKIAKSHAERVGNLSNHINVVFGQERLNPLRGMSWCVVMLQLPRSRCPQVRSLAPHSIAKATKDFQVVFFVNVLVLRCVLVMSHPTGTKEKFSITLTLLRTCMAFFGFWDFECFHCDDCALVSWSCP